ncbi:hypothetical protein ACRRTK_013209 [Alexandromys fortis]
MGDAAHSSEVCQSPHSSGPWVQLVALGSRMVEMGAAWPRGLRSVPELSDCLEASLLAGGSWFQYFGEPESSVL